MNELTRRYANEYMGKVFYFCLKKTDDAREAEDLAQEISLCVCAQLFRGARPRRFSAWVWRIARNRYSRWAEKKRARRENVRAEDIASLPLADDAPIDAALSRREEVSLLRRELALISSDYRNVVVAFYIDDIKAKDIARALQLPESTVRSKLLRARAILREGMNMAREFGKMSYRPEDVGFIMSGKYGKFGEPWLMLNRKLLKNILLAAYRTPSTAQALSIELGVALPYMENELESLTASTLMRKSADRYETNIIIIGAAAQAAIYANARKIAPELASAVTALMEYEIECNLQNCPDWICACTPLAHAKWALLMQTVDRVSAGALDLYRREHHEAPLSPAHPGIYGRTARPNGGEWDLVGLEDYRGDRPAFVGLHGCVDVPESVSCADSARFEQYRFQYLGIEKKTPNHLRYEEALALRSAIDGDTAGTAQTVLDALVGYGYLKRAGNAYTPAFLVMKSRVPARTASQQAECDRRFASAARIAQAHCQFCRNAVRAQIPPFFREDRYQIENACSSIFNTRGTVLEQALQTGTLTYIDDESARTLGAYMLV